MSIIANSSKDLIVFNNRYNNDIDTVLQISDIHIRKFKYHRFYNQVFERVYNEIKTNYLNNHTIILVTGDIVHSKNDMSPELIKEVTTFLNNLSNLLPTVIIAGNHDTLVKNTNRLDALTPLVNAVQNDNLIYLKSTGNYDFANNIRFSLSSVFDYEKPKKEISSTRKNIFLFHGAVNNLTNNFGYLFVNSLYSASDFNDYDFVMLGDIHKHQTIQYKNIELHKPHIVMCGSLIQQNFGETVDKHGIVKWNLNETDSNKIINFIEIQNDFKFIKLILDKGNVFQNLDKYDEIIRNTELVNINIINKDFNNDSNIAISSLKMNYNNIYNIKVIDDYSNESSMTNLSTIDNIKNLSNVDYQESLIRDYIKTNNIDLEEEYINEICELNKELNKKLPDAELSLFNSWKPLKLKFDNMFGFGEGNVIDFTNIKGITGLFASNYSGKSFILEILLFAMFDKTLRITTTKEMINYNANNFDLEFVFENNGIVYKIHKFTTKVTESYTKIDIELFQSINGEFVLLDNSERKVISKKISSYFVDFETFIYTNLSMQNQHFGFIDLKQTARKKFLITLFSLNIYNQLFIIVNNLKRDLTGYLKQTDITKLVRERDDNSEQIKTINIESDNIDIKITSKNNVSTTINKNISEIEEHINELNSEFSTTVEKFNIEDIQKEININTDNINNLININSKLKSEIVDLENNININENFLNEYSNINLIKDKINNQIKPQLYLLKNNLDTTVLNYSTDEIELKLQELLDRINNFKIKFDELQISINNKEIKLTKLKELNKTLESNFDNKESYKQMKEIEAKLVNSLTLISKDYDYYKKVSLVEYDKNCNYCMNNPLVKESIENENKFNKIKINMENLIEQTEINNRNLEKLNYSESDTNKYLQNKIKISDIEKELSKLKMDELSIKNNIEKCNSNIEKHKKIKENIIKNLDDKNKVKSLTEELNQYSLIMSEFNSTEKENTEFTEKINKLKMDIKNNELSIKDFENLNVNKNQIITTLKFNKEISEKINLLKSKLRDEKEKLSKNNKTIEKLKNKIITNNNTVATLTAYNKKINAEIHKIVDYEKKIKLYNNYSNIINYNSGIPVHIINNLLPIINNKVNEILELIASFSVNISKEEDNINISVLYEKSNRKMNINLCSGFEKTIVAIAFKVAFVEIANLPKFLIIDEGFSAFDSTNLSSLNYIFDLLRNKLDFGLFITHNNDIKGMVDDIITIDKETKGINGELIEFSKIVI